MKKLLMSALIAAQIGAASTPAFAADLPDERGATVQRQGAFAGARLRIPFGDTADRKVRAGLAVAPFVQGRGADGSVRTRFGEGLELGFSGNAKARVSFAGVPVSQLAQGPQGPNGRKAGVSTIGWVAIGVGVVVVSLVAITALCMSDSECNPSE